jgi:hypothetical protein
MTQRDRPQAPVSQLHNSCGTYYRQACRVFRLWWHRYWVVSLIQMGMILMGMGQANEAKLKREVDMMLGGRKYLYR